MAGCSVTDDGISAELDAGLKFEPDWSGDPF